MTVGGQYLISNIFLNVSIILFMIFKRTIAENILSSK
jgi:uncharacterized membrane protein